MDSMTVYVCVVRSRWVGMVVVIVMVLEVISSLLPPTR